MLRKYTGAGLFADIKVDWNDFSNQESSLTFRQLQKEHALGDSALREQYSQEMNFVTELFHTQVEKKLGQHLLAEYYLPRIFDLVPEYLTKILILAAHKAKATVLGSNFMLDENTGDISCCVVIAESHFVLHYFRKQRYLALDAYTCGELDMQPAVDLIAESLTLPSPRHQYRVIRGVVEDTLFKRPRRNFVPRLAVETATSLRFFDHLCVEQDNFRQFGQHLIGELFYCKQSKINDVNFLLSLFHDLADQLKIDVLEFKHEFKPQGVSIALIANGFHITTHTWPELAYAPIDMWVSNKYRLKLDEVMKTLAKEMDAKKFSMHPFPRGLHVPDANESALIRQDMVRRPGF